MRWFGLCLIILLIFGGGYLYLSRETTGSTVSPIGQMFEKPFTKYSIEALGKREFQPSQIIVDETIATSSAYTVHLFHYLSEGKKVTGLAHLPTRPEPAEGFPVIVQFRGYVDRQKYTPGEGTKRSAQVFAQNGFISLAPDFLGYGGSDMPSDNIFEERFQTITAALTLLSSISSVSIADARRIGIWGHSNGGQIALMVLEATQKPYPTVLWAPVTKPFPYSILYYTDDAPDHGKFLRKKLSEFENEYDVENYSLTNYLERLAAPVQLHQGLSDEAVPKAWSDLFVHTLKEKQKDVVYFTYPATDHNMMPAWNTVVSRDIEFFRLRFGERK